MSVQGLGNAPTLGTAISGPVRQEASLSNGNQLDPTVFFNDGAPVLIGAMPRAFQNRIGE